MHAAGNDLLHAINTRRVPMKSRFYFLPIVFLTVVCAVGVQAQLETVGGPYTVDTNTVVLLHFDNNMANAAATVGKTDTAAVRHTTTPSRLLPE
jgi:ABC-type sulfate transport system permease component